MNYTVQLTFIVKLRLIYKASGNLVTPRYIVKLRFVVKMRIVKSRSNCIFIVFTWISFHLQTSESCWASLEKMWLCREPLSIPNGKFQWVWEVDSFSSHNLDNHSGNSSHASLELDQPFFAQGLAFRWVFIRGGCFPRVSGCKFQRNGQKAWRHFLARLAS